MAGKEPEAQQDGGATSGSLWHTCARWSTAMAGGRTWRAVSREAWVQIRRAYWYPFYAYARRAGGEALEVQHRVEVFMSQLLAADAALRLPPGKVRFRIFLLAQFRTVPTGDAISPSVRLPGIPLVPLVDLEHAERRYHLESIARFDAEGLYEFRWALTAVDRSLNRLRTQFLAPVHVRTFNVLQEFLTGDEAPSAYAQASRELGLSEENVRVIVRRMRQRYRDYFRQEVLGTVSDPAEVEDEMRYLLRVIAG
jgi:RNA polymerase sigma-70 factor (ECF subfamily)